MNGVVSSRGAGRNLGVDTLRCVAMLLIVCLHIMNRGGALPSPKTEAATLIYPLRILASSAVNMYALISGYVMLQSRFRPARVLELWLQVWVLNVVVGLIGDWINPNAMDEEFWVRYLFPFTQKAYWYFTAYVGVYAFSPLINRGIRGLNRVQAVSVLWIMLLVFSLGSTLGYLNQGDPFSIGAGYSVLWLLALYTVGACIRRTDFLKNVSSLRLAIMLVLTIVGMTVLHRLALLPNSSPFMQTINARLLDYTFPLISAVSVLMLLLFARLRVGGPAGKLIAFSSPLTFGVYIIHVHHVLWIPMQGAFRFLTKLPGALLPFGIILVALAGFVLCALADYLRSLLFRALRVSKAAARIEAAIRGWLSRIIKETNG